MTNPDTVSMTQSQVVDGDAMGALSHLLAGLLLYGGLGWAGKHFWHQDWMLPVGIIVGFAMGVMLLLWHYGPRRSETTGADAVQPPSMNKEQ